MKTALDGIRQWLRDLWSTPSSIDHQVALTGRRVFLDDQGEGWFAGYTRISGVIEAAIQSDDGLHAYYVVRLEPRLTLRDSEATTRFGHAPGEYSHCVLHCRWEGYDINADAPVSVHLLLVPIGRALPRSQAEVVTLSITVWASCAVAPETPG